MQYDHSTKNTYSFFIVLIYILAIFIYIVLFAYNIENIKNSLENLEPSLWIITSIVYLFRIALLAGMSLYMFKRWLKSKSPSLLDVPFLFAMMFYFVCHGKVLDFFIGLTYYSHNENTILLLLKIHYVVIVFLAILLMYLCFTVLFLWIDDKYDFEILQDGKSRDKWSFRIIGLILSIEFILIFFSTSLSMIVGLLAFFTVPFFVGAALIFFYSYKKRLFPQVRTLTMWLGFLLWAVTSILRQIIFINIGPNIYYIIIAESLDLAVSILIFASLCKKEILPSGSSSSPI